MRRIAFVLVAVVACGDKRPVSEAGASSAPADGRMVDVLEPAPVPVPEREREQPPAPPPPEIPFDSIQESACKQAGGRCLSHAECSGGVYIEGLACRSSLSGLGCCRVPADCPEHETSSCCAKFAGEVVSVGGAGCDRGHVSCAGRGDAWLTKTGSCDTSARLEPPSEAEPSRWPDAVSTLEAGRWACEQARGKLIPYGAECEGYLVGLAPLPCCVPPEGCPERALTECCNRGGRAEPKVCRDGRAVCEPALIGIGALREVAAGECGHER